MSVTPPAPVLTRPPRTGVRALVVAAAAASALVVWAGASLLLDAEVTVPEGPGSDLRGALETSAVAVTAVAAALAGWALLEVLERITRRARAIWTGVAVAVLVLTLPYLPGFAATERVVLVLLHGALAAPLILGMRGPGGAGLHR